MPKLASLLGWEPDQVVLYSGMFDLHIQNLSRAQALFDTLNKQTRNEYSDLIRLKKTVPIL